MNARLTDRIRFRAAPIACAVLFNLLAAPAAAQDERPRGRLVTIGGGVQATPQFPGADSLSIRPMPIVDIRRVGEPIKLESPDEGWGFGLLRRDARVNLGPAVQFQGRRDEDDVGAPVGNVGFTVEVGAFAEVYPSERFRLRAEGRRGIGGHKAWVGDVAADLFARDGDRTIFSIGPRLRIGDADYVGAYYGVTPAAALASGLPAFVPEGGIFAVGGTAGIRPQFGRSGRGGVEAYGRYDRLVGDAADSPIVAQFGSENQFGAGIGLSYTFRVGGR